MKKIFNWIKNHTADILIVLGAISAILVNLQTSGVVNPWVTLSIACIAVAIEILKYGVSEKAIKLITEVILIILEMIKDKNVVGNSEAVGASAADIETRIRKAIK